MMEYEKARETVFVRSVLLETVHAPFFFTYIQVYIPATNSIYIVYKYIHACTYISVFVEYLANIFAYSEEKIRVHFISRRCRRHRPNAGGLNTQIIRW